MRAIDTNVLVRLITRDDSRQTAAADQFILHGAWVPILALTEATWVLTTVYGRNNSDIVAALEMLLDHEHLVLQDSDAIAAAVALFRARPSLGLTDCLMVELSRKAGHRPFGTFDRNLGKIDGAVRL